MENAAKPRIETNYRLLGISTPRSFSEDSWDRFRKDRRELLLRRCGGDPSDYEVGLIERIIDADWRRRALEAEADTQTGKVKNDTLRKALEYRRQLVLEDRELEKSIRVRMAADIKAAGTRGRNLSPQQQIEALRHMTLNQRLELAKRRRAGQESP